MARNKHPEETVEKILSVSAKLFIEKGYDKTSVKDIINELGMSKGAIYHHFKSKEQILDAVLEKSFKNQMQILKNVLDDVKGSSVKEQLSQAFEHLAGDDDVRQMDDTIMSQITNPHFIVNGLKKDVNEVAPIIAKIIEAGNNDGSIRTNYPDEAAEVLMLLLNLWLNPVLFERNREETIKRIKFLQHLMKMLGVDVISDNMIEKINKTYTDVGGYEKKSNET